MNKPIYVTKTFLPPIEEYEEYLKQIWQSHLLTNQGPLVLELEDKLKNYLGVKYFQFVSNGTSALQLALRSLDITEGEIITTPFSYVATVSSILWERCEPVFVDIEADTFCIDADKIEAAITPKTKAIMPVHVFGNACDVEKIGEIAKKHNLKVIYDAAHAFGVTHKGKSLLDYGDISICSFHSTKVFHTIEGGGLVFKDTAAADKAELTKRFGHQKDDHIMLGTNAKASEFQAAMGLCNLKYINQIIADRKRVCDRYDHILGGQLQTLKIQAETTYNYAYYPVVLKSNHSLATVLKKLAEINVFPRRYFYPSLNKLPYLEGHQPCPVSEDIASRILCLPLYVGLEEEIINKICKVILSVESA